MGSILMAGAVFAKSLMHMVLIIVLSTGNQNANDRRPSASELVLESMWRPRMGMVERLEQSGEHLIC